MEKTLYTGNYVLAKVEGEKLVLSAAELQQYLDDGYDVEILGYPRE
jgi:hypothetical protein